MPTPAPTPTPTPNPYGPMVMTVDPKPLQANAAVPMSMPLTTASDAARNNVLQAEQQNAAIAAASGKAGGSRTLKRSNKGKRSKGSKGSNRSSKQSKRSKKARRSKRFRRGGAAPPTTTTPTPRPTATVPQFGSQNPGANMASAQLNSGAMVQAAEAKFDNPNAPATTIKLQ